MSFVFYFVSYKTYIKLINNATPRHKTKAIHPDRIKPLRTETQPEPNAAMPFPRGQRTQPENLHQHEYF